MRISRELESLFGSSEVVLLADDQTFLTEATAAGAQTRDLNSVESMPENAVVISFSKESARRVAELGEDSEDARILFCAAHVFDNSLPTAHYTLELISQSDFYKALITQENLTQMLNSTNAVSFQGNGSFGEVRFKDGAHPVSLSRDDVKGGFALSVAEFFEVQYAHVKSGKPCPFHLEGTLSVSGILSVHRPSGVLPYSGAHEDARNLVNEIANANETILSATDNSINSLLVDGKEKVGLLRDLAGERGCSLTEFAIGVNPDIEERVDYGFNSQINEGVEGIHVAVGDGASGFHIDFLCPKVHVSPKNEERSKKSLILET